MTSRVVQCFGTLIRPSKAAKPCRKQYLWTARDSGANNFGRRGVQACPHCGTMPDFTHPVNKFLGGDITQEQAQKELAEDYNPDWTKKEKVSS